MANELILIVEDNPKNLKLVRDTLQVKGYQKFPLKVGFELYIGAVDEKPNPKLQFQFDVVLNEHGIIDGEPVLGTIQRFAKLVDEIVATLTPLLK